MTVTVLLALFLDKSVHCFAVILSTSNSGRRVCCARFAAGSIESVRNRLMRSLNHEGNELFAVSRAVPSRPRLDGRQAPKDE